METFEEFKKQCGEIYLLSSGTMTFHCILCEEKYSGFDDFAEHVNLKHTESDDYQIIKEETLEDIHDIVDELNAFSETIDSHDDDNDSNGEENVVPMGSNEENLIAAQDTETKFSVADELSFEVAYVEENFEIDSNKKSVRKTPRNLNVKKAGNPKKIIPRRPRTSHKFLTRNSHVCTECDYSTNLKVKLVEHLRRHFNDRPFSCDFCEQRFYMQNEKTRHTARQHPETVELKKPSPEKLELKARIKSSLISLGDNKFQCKECDYTCEGRAPMWYHIRRHSTYKPYQCTICPKTFYTSNELNTHIRSHTGEKPFLCTECGNAFSTSSKLSTHLKRHNNIRDKECSVCQRRFFNTRQLQSHMACHSDERPFSCEICKSTFKRRKTLSSHMKVHSSKQLQQTAYQCEICDAGFNQQTGLLIHIRAKHTLTNKEQISDSDIKIEYE